MDTHKIAGCTVHLDRCGEHVHIVLADGRRGPALFSNTEALELLKLLEWSGLLSDDEIPELKQQIYNSTLPDEAPPDIDALEDMLKSLCYSIGTYDNKGSPDSDVEDYFEHPNRGGGRILH